MDSNFIPDFVCLPNDTDIDRHHRKRPFKCMTCHNRYDSRYNLTIHKQKYAGERPCTCTECGKRFHCRNHLNKHMQKMHDEVTEVISVACYICEKVFHNESRLKLHIKSHLKDLIYKCFRCHEIYMLSSLFKEHIKTHNIQPNTANRALPIIYECPECDIGFSSVKLLVQHLTAVHQSDEDYRCSICGRNFPYKSYLQAHQCKNFYSCPNCDVTLTSEKLANLHLMNEHPNEYTMVPDFSHKCGDCLFRFTTEAKLEHHICRPGK